MPLKTKRIEMTVDIFDLAQQMFDAGRTEVHFRNRWTVGTAQKLFAIFRCDRRFPQVNQPIWWKQAEDKTKSLIPPSS